MAFLLLTFPRSTGSKNLDWSQIGHTDRSTLFALTHTPLIVIDCLSTDWSPWEKIRATERQMRTNRQTDRQTDSICMFPL